MAAYEPEAIPVLIEFGCNPVPARASSGSSSETSIVISEGGQNTEVLLEPLHIKL